MNFSLSTYDAIIQGIKDIIDEIERRLELTYIIIKAVCGIVWDVVKKAVDVVWEQVRNVLAKIVEFLEGAAAPVLFFFRAIDWANNVGSPLSEVQTTVDKKNSSLPLSDGLSWTGDAATRYQHATGTQSAAAATISTRANELAIQLGICAGAGLAFYTAVILALKTLIAGIAAAAVEVVTVVGAVAAPPTIGAALGAAAFQLSVGLAALSAAQFNITLKMKTMTQDGGVFVSSRWPTGTA